MAREISGISLISSCGCNLKCDYCYINKSVNTSQSKIQKATIKALQNGDFLNNCKQVLKKLNINPMNITYLSLWGQEPTLTLKFLTEHLEDWFLYFSNLQHIEFCSNGMGFQNDIADFIQKVDSLTTFSNFSINIQFSYDGKYSTDHLRHGNSNLIFHNIKELILKLNNIKLSHVNLEINFHGVLSFELLKKELTTYEKILDYYQDLDNFAFQLSELSLNKKINVFNKVGICIEAPYEATFLDGFLLKNFIDQSLRLPLSSFHSKHDKGLDILGPLHHFKFLLNQYNVRSPKELLDKAVTNPEIYKNICNSISQALYCGNGYNELKIMYDGTLINCQNSIYETEEQYLPQNDNSIINLVKKSLIQHQYFINPLINDQESIDRYFDLFETQKESSFYFIFSQVLILIYYLAKAQQVDRKYLINIEELCKAAFVCTTLYCCAYNNLICSGSAFIVHSGFLRQYCNGILDFTEL